MKLTAWVVLGALLVDLLLVLLVAGACGALPVRAGEPHARAVPRRAGHAHQGVTPPAPAPRAHHGYLVEARMGWAVG
jgi:hypothetical protein